MIDRTMIERRTLYRMARAALVTISSMLMLSLTLLLAACFPIAQPRSVADSLVYVEGQTQAVVRTCTRLSDERRITVQQAIGCKTAAEQSFFAIDVGRGAAKAGDLTKAQAQLDVARTLLIELEKLTGGAK
jgi:hypothetical protein